MLKDIIEIRSIGNILHKKGIYKQYIKAKNNILSGNIGKTYFKEKNPKGSGIWYFRINRQYRAL